jgi:hypothetical protein
MDSLGVVLVATLERQKIQKIRRKVEMSNQEIRNLAGMPEDMRLLRKFWRRFDSGDLSIYLRTEDTL